MPAYGLYSFKVISEPIARAIISNPDLLALEPKRRGFALGVFCEENWHHMTNSAETLLIRTRDMWKNGKEDSGIKQEEEAGA